MLTKTVKGVLKRAVRRTLWGSMFMASTEAPAFRNRRITVTYQTYTQKKHSPRMSRNLKTD